jgi:alginate O-acetyltransferase complex protein AlgI
MNVLWYATALILVWLAAMRLSSIRARQLLYLFASWLFYFSWGAWLIVVLIFSSAMNYALGEWLKKRITVARLWTGIALNLILLGVFKYLPLIGDTAPGPFGFLKRIVIPFGLSFWTFEALSYLLELYREEELNPTFAEFCLYMAFWPTVLQGPICRMSSMLPQFRQNWSVTADDLKTGVRRIAIGALMLVLASVLGGGLYPGTGVEAIFANTAVQLGGTDVWFVIVAYGFQLYFSFCGYSHLVIGVARLFGLQLQENFDRPYLSTTPSVFWTRWHMSLSFWIRDFIFLPLATARREVWWRNLSLVIAMVVFGLWHITPAEKGNLLFLVWGAYHGILLVLHRQWQELRKRLGFEWSGTLPSAISWLLTFSAVCVGYIFFRSESLAQALAMLRAIVSLHSYGHRTLQFSFYAMTLSAFFGYFIVIGAGELLDRVGESAREWPRRTTGTLQIHLGSFFGALADERWVWLAPSVLVLMLYLSVIFQPGHSEAGPVMYALF